MNYLHLLIYFILLFLTNRSLSQINPPHLNQIITSDHLNKLKNAVIKKMSDARADYDSSSFNYAVALSDNAGLFENEQKFRKNQKILLEAIKTADGQKSTPMETASNYNEAGEMMYAGNHFATAEASFKKAIKIFENEGELKHPVYTLVLSNLGLLYHTTGRYSLSEKYTTDALTLRKEIFGTNNPSYAASINNLAVLYKDMGKFGESERLIRDAILINQNSIGKASVPFAFSLNNQAMIFQALGRYNDAEPILKEALDIADSTLKEKSTNYVRLMINLALLYQEMKKYNEAEEIYNKAIKIKESKLGTHHPDYAHLLNNLAALYMLMPKYEKVEELLKHAASIYKKQFGQNHPSYGGVISNLGNFYRVTGRLAEADPLLQQALMIRKEALGESHPDYYNSIESLGLLNWQMGNTSQASTLLKSALDKYINDINAYFAPMSESEKAKFWDKIRPKFLKFNSFVSENYSQEPSLVGDLYNYQLATKALLLNTSSKIKQQILSSGDNELINEYKQWIDEKENLARLYSLSKAELAEEHINIDSIENSCNLREKNLSSKSNLFSSSLNQPAISFKDIQSVLEDDEAAIEIIQFNKFTTTFTDTIWYSALILTKENTLPKLVVLKDGKLLEKKYYNIYKNSIKQKLIDNNSYEQYWSNIDKEIPTKNNLFVSMDGIYNQINLNTLKSSKGYLIDSKNIRIVTNTKDIIEFKKNISSSSLNTSVLIGFPDYGKTGSITKLPGTKVEIESIKSILLSNKYSVKTFLQSDANETTIKTASNPKILHIATHGFFLSEEDGMTQEKVFGIESSKSKENPMLRSGVLLAGAEDAIDGKSENGILFAFEVMNLSLDKTEIVVLSACETGLGDVKNGEGVYGLQRAFRVAGANSIIMSFWKVNDEATQLLMTNFYKYYVISKNKETAFKKAQQDLKSKFKDPYYWGAFVMVE